MTEPAWARHLPADADADGVDVTAAGTLLRSWTQRWAAAPEAATVFDDDGGWIDAGELEDRSRAVARRLAAAGLAPGDRILVSAATSTELVVAHLGALRAGLVVVPANTAYREREIAHLVRDAEPAAAIVDDEDRARWIAAAAVGRAPIVVGPDVGLPDGAEPAWLDAASPDDPALVAYTSGTTGAPKGAVLSHRNLLASAEALRLAWRWAASDRLVLPLPLFHLHGLGVGLHGSLHAGASVVLRPSFDAADVVASVSHHRASLLFGVPTTWGRLLRTAGADQLRSLRLGVSGSAPLDPTLHAAIAEATGLRLLERYGMTETIMLVSNPYDGERRPGTVGFPLPGVEVRLVEGTDEIEVRGPNVFRGYRGGPPAVDPTGWFATGDVGAVDADGYLRIVGRRKELIITGGYNVYPREVEDVLRRHRGVVDAAVVGVPDDRWGERVVAVVEGDLDDGDVAALLDSAAELLAPYKRPKQVVVVDALPRNALGKVVRATVQELLRS